jgi:hypothetical protein
MFTWPALGRLPRLRLIPGPLFRIGAWIQTYNEKSRTYYAKLLSAEPAW